MNQVKGVVQEIHTRGTLSLVTIDVGQVTLSAVVLEKPETNSLLKPGHPVIALFKETEVSIAKELSGSLSIRNRFEGPVTWIEKGEILTKIGVQFKDQIISCLITTRSCDQMAIRIGETVTALVKSNEIMLLNPAEQ